MKKEAAANADKYELITVDGQGDIAKQVNDIEDLITQHVDAIAVHRQLRLRGRPGCATR